jgi:hypothetical protein
MAGRTPGPAGALACVRSALAILAAAITACTGPATAPPPTGEGSAPTAPSAGAPVGEATCTTAPLKARVLSLRQDSPDSVRIEIALSNLLAPGTAADAEAAAVTAAVRALEGWSVLAAGGRRRAFPLRREGGGRVGVPAEVPPPGATRTFWAAFPVVDGPISLLLPGFPPMPGLVVPPVHGVRPEP